MGSITLLELIQNWDVKILLFFNQDLQSKYLDFLFPYFTNIHKISWIKFFTFPVLGVWWLHRARLSAVRIFIALLLTAGISDVMGYRLLKPAFNRVRPNNNPVVEPHLRLLRNPASNSFPSNHSMNSFAVVTVIVFYYPYLAWPLYPLAAVIGMFRMYAGVHYPSDVVVGALLGILLGGLLYRGVFSRYALFRKKKVDVFQ